MSNRKIVRNYRRWCRYVNRYPDAVVTPGMWRSYDRYVKLCYSKIKED